MLVISHIRPHKPQKVASSVLGIVVNVSLFGHRTVSIYTCHAMAIRRPSQRLWS